jgi:hypothetical protein
MLRTVAVGAEFCAAAYESKSITIPRFIQTAFIAVGHLMALQPAARFDFCGGEPSALSAAPVLMALVTVDAVVNVISYSLVISVRLVLQVAIGALENRIVVRVGMAGRTHSVGIAVIDGELRVLGMIEGSVQPAGGVVASLASCGEKLRLR